MQQVLSLIHLSLKYHNNCYGEWFSNGVKPSKHLMSVNANPQQCSQIRVGRYSPWLLGIQIQYRQIITLSSGIFQFQKFTKFSGQIKIATSERLRHALLKLSKNWVHRCNNLHFFIQPSDVTTNRSLWSSNLLIRNIYGYTNTPVCPFGGIFESKLNVSLLISSSGQFFIVSDD